MSRAALAEPEPRNQCAETCERAKLCATCARGIDGAEQAQPVGLDAVYKTIVRWDEEGIHSRAALARRIVALYTTPAPQPMTELPPLPPLPPEDVLHDLHDEPCPACNTMLRALPPIKLGYTASQMRNYARAVEAEVIRRMGAR